MINILLEKCFSMCFFMSLGYFLTKIKLLSSAGIDDLTKLLMKVVAPCSVVQSFMIGRTPKMLEALGISAVLAIVASLLCILPSYVFFRKYPIENLCASFNNVGFIGVPMVIALFGKDAVFYVAFYVVLTGVLQWSWGVYILTGDRKHIKIKTILLNPISVAFLVALMVFLTGLGGKVPSLIGDSLSMITSMLGPLCMIVMGCYLANVRLTEIFSAKTIWVICFFRLVLSGILVALTFWFIPKQFELLRQVVFIAAICPVASYTATLSRLFGKDSGYAVSIICLSTILSVITIPAMFYLANILWSVSVC